MNSLPKSLSILFILCFVPFLAFAQNDGNGGGAVRISFGNENVEPVTLSGDDPAVPPKPKREFHTNSLVLNQILAECADLSSLRTLLPQLQSSSKITLLETPDAGNCFLIVIRTDAQEVIAVLDKGSGKRMNLLNNQFETDDLYKGEDYEKIWFLLLE